MSRPAATASTRLEGRSPVSLTSKDPPDCPSWDRVATSSTSEGVVTTKCRR